MPGTGHTLQWERALYNKTQPNLFLIQRVKQSTNQLIVVSILDGPVLAQHVQGFQLLHDVVSLLEALLNFLRICQALVAHEGVMNPTQEHLRFLTRKFEYLKVF